MRTGRWTLIVVLLLCLNSIILLLLWQKKGIKPLPGNQLDPRDFLVKELSFTPSQAAKFDSLRAIHHHKIDSLDNVEKLLKDSLFHNIGNQAMSAGSVSRLTDEIGRNAALIDKTTFYHFRQVRSMLDAGQQHKFDGIIEEVLHRMARPQPPGMPPSGRPMPPNGPDGPPGGGQQLPPPPPDR